MPFEHTFVSIPEILEEAKDGKMFILVDDEDRENEGDLIVIAEHATPEKINFMTKYARGLICLAIHSSIAQRLELKLHKRINIKESDTAFTYSIDAKDGITTGISAYDRAKTIAVAINKNSSIKDIQIPGHIFPVLANDNGVLSRKDTQKLLWILLVLFELFLLLSFVK